MSSKEQLKYIMEFLGTFILSGAINLSTIYVKSTTNEDDPTNPIFGHPNQIGQPILLFLAFFAAITITRGISGGHLNPAVTLAVCFSKKPEENENEIKESLIYVIAQILGAFCSCFISYIFYGNILQLTLHNGASPIGGFVIELISTFIFTYTILCQGNKDAKLASDQTISTFIIVIALYGTCGIAGNVTGGCLNPAIGIAHNLSLYFVSSFELDEIRYIWLYIFGPATGGILAAVVYNFFFLRHFEGIKQRENLINQR